MSEQAGIWLRVSSGGQDEANQLPDVERHCEAHGYDVRRRYELNDKSAWKGQQDEKLAEMLADVRTGAIKVLVVWHSDRLERRGVEALFRLLRQVREAGGRVESVKEPNLGAADVGSEAVTAIGAIIARQKSVHLSEQVLIAKDHIRTNGALDGKPPFGYTSTGDKYSRRLVPTEEGRRLIPEVYRRYVDGASLQDIADWLPGNWWAKSVAELIRNTTYAGYRQDSEGRTVHQCEALVDASLWRRANDRLGTMAHHRGTARAETTALLTSVLKCGRCNGPMYRIQSGHGKSRKPAYRCAGKGPQRKGCGMFVDLAYLEDIVDEEMSSNYLPVIERVFIPGHDYESEIQDVRLRMRALAAEDLPDDEHDAKLAELRSERDRLIGLSKDSEPGHWRPVIVTDERGEVVTHASRWNAADHQGRRALLLDQVKITFAWSTLPDGSRIPLVTIVPAELGEA